MEPFLSVIVPVYKVEAYLHECVDSILRQTFHDMEIILVDDGSPDSCPKICDEYAEKDSRIRVIHQKNGGTVRARNAGINVAKGKYITFVDSDDWIEAEMYQTMYDLVKEHEADILITDYYYNCNGHVVKYENHIEAGFYEGEKLLEMQKRMIYSGEFYQFGIYPVLWNKWYKREILIENMICIDQQISWGEDMAWTYPSILDASKIYIYKEQCFYHYRYRADAMTKASDPYYFSKFRHLYEYMDMCLYKKKREDLLEQLEYHKIFTFVMGIQQEIGSLSDILHGRSIKRLRKCILNEDIFINMRGVHVDKLEIPFLYKCIWNLFREKKIYLTLCLGQIMRIWTRFLWK